MRDQLLEVWRGHQVFMQKLFSAGREMRLFWADLPCLAEDQEEPLVLAVLKIVTKQILTEYVNIVTTDCPAIPKS